TPACTAARQALATARAQDATEDKAERAVAETEANEAAAKTEDQSELAALKSLFNAAVTACGPQFKVTALAVAPTSACTVAKQALSAAISQARAAHTTLSSTQFMALMKAAVSACGFGGFKEFDTRQQSSFTFSWKH
ncbi:MAG: hypothetical protein WB682_15470, partial [Candidatus Dormiibacterota bacterium]